MKNIYLICGPSGSGKTTLADLLQAKYGYKEVESYTTRPPRYPGETGHIFVTEEEFYDLGALCAYTHFDGNDYGVTPDIIDQNDLYVIDIRGIEYLKKHYHGPKGIVVIAVDVIDRKVLADRMHQRGDPAVRIEQRMKNDKEEFKNLTDTADKIIFSDLHTPEELADLVNAEIQGYEYPEI